MAFYPAGTVFEFPAQYGPNDVFGEGCVFPDGSSFRATCTFGPGCVFGAGCSFFRVVPPLPPAPPSVTMEGCVFGLGCYITAIILGEANVLDTPITYSPEGVGPDVIVFGLNNKAEGGGSNFTSGHGGNTVVDGSESKATTDWCKASNPSGLTGDVTVVDPSRCIPTPPPKDPQP